MYICRGAHERGKRERGIRHYLSRLFCWLCCNTHASVLALSKTVRPARREKLLCASLSVCLSSKPYYS